MPLKPVGRTSLVSESTTLNSICRIGCPTEPTTFKKAHKREKKKSLLRIEQKEKSEMSEDIIKWQQFQQTYTTTK